MFLACKITPLTKFDQNRKYEGIRGGWSADQITATSRRTQYFADISWMICYSYDVSLDYVFVARSMPLLWRHSSRREARRLTSWVRNKHTALVVTRAGWQHLWRHNGRMACSRVVGRRSTVTGASQESPLEKNEPMCADLKGFYSYRLVIIILMYVWVE